MNQDQDADLFLDMLRENAMLGGYGGQPNNHNNKMNRKPNTNGNQTINNILYT